MPRPRIVIALDPERVSPEAIELGHALALATAALREEADEVLRSVGDRLRERGHDVDERVRAAASIGGVLHDAGRRGDTGLIVLGPAHHGPADGCWPAAAPPTSSTARPVPPRRYLPTPAWPRRIGVAYSDSAEGREALRAAAALVRRTAASLRVISVSDTRLLWAAPLAPQLRRRGAPRRAPAANGPAGVRHARVRAARRCCSAACRDRCCTVRRARCW
jgi:nucleotide-binding universal stress UspA family protein